jgi:hypothetical protein
MCLHVLQRDKCVTESRTSLRLIHFPVQWIKRALSPWVKQPGREADCLPPSSIQAKNVWCFKPASTTITLFHGIVRSLGTARTLLHRWRRDVPQRLSVSRTINTNIHSKLYLHTAWSQENKLPTVGHNSHSFITTIAHDGMRNAIPGHMVAVCWPRPSLRHTSIYERRKLIWP